ncbi:hypothetical protein MCOR27_010649 [Pyricularia oryzae]|uniref:Shugoshin n=2 Tax=Pyricularia TaxID=48558 RepID=A0ABQ8N4L8_PYRGI|nr:hypothetical protein MCOR01_006414 [Pyricularia oryzae]KAI6291197.1 hypothetical protein MCOR33_010778 [Pyricularia grisea]KAH9435759.1 hypothetical protein MCOR02_004677 [Pyricularia oryzae]KAI6252853.1 hypothetical protein MCOR19_010561 [Pyricularia oryzae]KAI6267313.1 hypothetical protein MCOR27_010649 [Pyricularia oryzae]
MARLNEPPVSADSLEILRRKFLRQNRDIARVNSTQSLRIRSLENECARLLSENLDLRGQILRLEKAAENNPAGRIADHALEIKAKMELQLLELGSLLDSLGLEPPMKRRSPNRGERKIAKPRRSSLGQSPRQKKTKEMSIEDQESLAAQEGRLPPIHEHKSYPRQTLNRREILALCSESEADAEAETSTDSPVLGPPPVSKYVEEEPEKVDSPNTARRVLVYSDITVSEKTNLAPPKIDPPETTAIQSPAKKAPRSPEPKVTPEPKADALQLPIPLAPAPVPAPVKPEQTVAKCGSKRKQAVADENEPPSFTKDNNTLSNSQSTPDKPKSATVREIKNRRNSRGLPGARREARDKKSSAAAPAPARPALAAKSTNEDVSSPRKLPAKGAAVDCEKPSNKAVTQREVKTKAAPPQAQAEPIPILPKSPSPPRVMNIHPAELAAPNSAAQLPPPGTPGRAAVKETFCDTPPPPDISSGGDTARPSRRSRASVSYAEPNLRDKMRRPSSELTDAVSGKTKYKQRASISHDTAPAPRSAAKEKPAACT